MNDYILKNKVALRIVAIYALVGFIWIYTSDTLLGWFVQDPNVLVRIAIYKGSFFILFTSLLLYLLISRYSRNLVSSELALKERVSSLLESESRLSLALTATNSGIWDWNVKSGTMFFDPNYFRLAGYEPDEFPHTYAEWEKRVHPADIENANEAIEKYLTGKTSTFAVEFRFKCKDGSWLWILGQGRVVERDEHGEPIRFTGMHTDVTDRKRVSEALRESEFFFKESQRAASIGSYKTDFITGTWQSSEVLDAIFGIDKEYERSVQSWLDIVFPDDREMMNQYLRDDVISQRKPFSKEYRIIRKNNGETRWVLGLGGVQVDSNNNVISLVGTIQDITERKQAEETRISLEKQLLHVQKLESMGVLAGGIAHDFNNILTAIIGNADLALMRINKESPATENLHRIEQAAVRAADLAKQMLAYSGKGKFVVESIDLNHLLEDMLHLLKISISKKAVLRFNLHQDLPAVEADATQIRQVVMNLVINASEAIGDKTGVISITTDCIDCDRNYLKDVWLDENVGEGVYVYLEIADNGCGMDKNTLGKIFDPFFTTKFTGRGLGMAAVSGILKGHKGAIKVYSEPEKGTTFKILLPASSRPSEIYYPKDRQDDWHRSGTVLLVDDEEAIREIGKEMLQEIGFTVVTAKDGREAVNKFLDNPDITFVILDLTMPHMDGEQCFRELRKIKTDIKVIMSSGFTEQEVTQKFAGQGMAGFIQKPYTFSALKEVIRLQFGL